MGEAENPGGSLWFAARCGYDESFRSVLANGPVGQGKTRAGRKVKAGKQCAGCGGVHSPEPAGQSTTILAFGGRICCRYSRVLVYYWFPLHVVGGPAE